MEYAHELGLVAVQENDVLVNVILTHGAFGHRAAHEERIPITDISEVLVRSTPKHAEVVFRVGERLLGLKLRYRKVEAMFAGAEGEYSPVDRLAQDLAEAGVPVQHVESFDRGLTVSWVEAGEKLGFWKSAGHDLKEMRAARNAVSAAGPEIQVKRYKNDREYEREARQLLANGWRMEGQSSHRGKVNMGRTVLKAGMLLPWAVMRPSRKGDPITVTWLRGGDLVEIAAAEVVGPKSSENIPEKLRELGHLRDEGILTADEFDAKKTELLQRL